MFPYWTFIKYGIPLLIGLVIGGWVAHKIDNIKIHRLEGENAKYVMVNEANQEAITKLKEMAEKADKICSERLKSKEKTIKKMKEVDTLKPGGEDAEKNPSDSGNTIIGVLNELW